MSGEINGFDPSLPIPVSFVGGNVNNPEISPGDVELRITSWGF